MRAVVATEFGGPEVLEVREVPDPQPADGELLVEVGFSDVGTLDRLVRSGWGRDFFDVAPPYVPGDGVAGVVRATGPGVDSGWVGRRVVGGTGPRTPDGRSAAPTGGYAALAVVAERAAVAVPDGLALELAAAVHNDGATTQQLLDVTDPGPDDVVLVLAAAGAAGVLLVQLAVARGARVLAAAHGPAKTAALRDLGVRHVVDYADADWTDQVRRLAPDGPTVVLDGAGSDLGRAGIALAADGARVVSYGSSAGEFADLDATGARGRGVTLLGLFDLPPLTPEGRAALVRRAFAAAAGGTAVPLVRHVPLAEAARAHADLEARAVVGKTLLVP